jgi:putative transposase
LIWLWVAIELGSKEILGISSISKGRNMLLAERLISSLVGIHGRQQHPVSTEGGGSWYPQAYRFLRLPHHNIHSSYEKESIIERTMQYIKKIEPNALITIFLAERRIVNYYMYGIG